MGLRRTTPRTGYGSCGQRRDKGAHLPPLPLWPPIPPPQTDVSRYHFWAEHDKKSAGLFSGLKAGADKIMDWQRLAPGAATGGSGGGGGSGEGAGSREGEAAGEEEAAEPVDEAWIRRCVCGESAGGGGRGCRAGGGGEEAGGVA